MSWSITLGRVFGSEIRMHLTFLILLAWIGTVHFFAGGWPAAVDGVLFILAVFACVVLHELGHALAARRYGIHTPDITLLPIGGLARLERMPEKPGQEMVIAIAGPLVNVAIVLILLALGARLDPQDFAVEMPTPSFIDRLAAVNVFLVAFNIIPAFPMDGGRVLRAALTLKLGRRRATELAAVIGQGIAFLFAFLGLISGNVILVFIAIFVYLAASAEAQTTSLMERASHMLVENAMIRAFEALGPQASVDDAAEALLRTTQREFPIVDGGGRLRGVLTREAMIRAMKTSGPHTPVLEAMDPQVPAAQLGERLDTALKRMQAAGAAVMAVNDRTGRFVGYVTNENIAELMMLEAVEWRADAPLAHRK